MAGLGALNVEVSANFAKFASDMEKVATIAQTNAAKIDKVFGVVATSLKAMGAGFAIGLTLDKVKDKIEGAIASAAGLQQLAERTGATVEGLSGLASVAKLSGTDTDALATGLQKLSKALVDAKDGGAKTTEAFNAIGISTKQLVGLKPDEAFLLISKQLAKYADGAEKTAIRQVVLGKAGANLAVVMNDLAVVGEYQVKVTADQAAGAEEYEKNLRRLDAVQNSVYKTIGLAIVPALDAFTKALLDTATGSDGLRGTVNELAKDGKLREWAEDALKVVGFVIDAFQGLTRVVRIIGDSLGALGAATASVLRGDMAGARAIIKEANDYEEKLATAPLFSATLAKRIAESHDKAAEVATKRPEIKFSPNSAVARSGDDPAKKILEGQLRDQEAFITAQKRLLAEAEADRDLYHRLEFFNLRETEEAKQQLIQASLAETLAAYDKEIAAATIYVAQAQKLTDKQEGRNKIADITAKRAAAEADAYRKLGDSQNALLAVRINFDNATAEGARQADKANAAQAFAISLMGKDTLEVMKATEAKRIQLALDERIYQLRKQDETVDVSEAIAAAEKEKANALALTEEAYNKQRTSAFGAQEAFRKYAEEAGNKGAQIENLLSNAFKGAEDALVNFVKTGKLDFKSLADSIISDIIRMQVKSALGTGGSSGGGILGMLGGIAGLFGGGQQGVGPNSGVNYLNGSDIGFSMAVGTNFVPYDGMKAVLHKGESVVPAAYNPANGANGGAGRSGNTYVTIEDHAGGKVTQTREQSGEDETLRIVIEQAVSAVAGEIQSGGRMHKAIAGTYGLNRANGAPKRG